MMCSSLQVIIHIACRCNCTLLSQLCHPIPYGIRLQGLSYHPAATSRYEAHI